MYACHVWIPVVNLGYSPLPLVERGAGSIDLFLLSLVLSALADVWRGSNLTRFAYNQE
jgi:hypothetical protein